MEQETQYSLIDLLAQHELRTRDLYTVYLQRFPEAASVWQKLCRDEEDHAKWLQELPDRVKADHLSIREDRFRAGAILTNLKYLDDEIKRASEPGFSLLNALTLAHVAETSMIEKNFFEIIGDESPEIKDVFQRLAESTQEHRAFLDEHLEKYKKITSSTVHP